MWSFEIINHHINEKEGEVLVLGKLTVGNIVKMQFGSSQITRAKASGEIISIADDLKAAATDSLKKCATQMGVGLYLYSKEKGSSDQVPSNSTGMAVVTGPNRARKVTATAGYRQNSTAIF